MGLEIERKFLVQGDGWKSLGTPVLFHQGYLNRNPERSVRVRIEGDMAKLNIKAKRGTLRRIEYEYAIPVNDATFLLEHVCEQPTLSKHRTKITIGDCCWEGDEFHGTNKGLVIAEIELENEEQSFEKHLAFMKYMQNLASIAINAKIPIVVTNSIRTFDENEKENLEKSINLFSHIKIRLTKNQGSYFCEVISPFINNKFQFNITTNGLTDES